MHFDGLIFDLDGTLWDCSKASAHAFNTAYKRMGVSKQVSESFVRDISGRPSSECDELLLRGVPLEQQEELQRLLDACEIQALEKRIADSIYPGVAQGLSSLSKHYRLFLVSNCNEPYRNIFLEQTSIGALFADSECHGRTLRPKSENIQMLVERQKLSSPCYIGDTEGDESAAVDAGVPFIHAGYGFGSPLGDPPSMNNFYELVRYFSS